MSFLNPILLAAGIACVALPVLIHILMRRRRKPIAWGAMEFLAQAYQRQRKRLRLEQLLLLATRCLVVLLLALALGRPLLDGDTSAGERGPRDVYVVLDDSIAAQAQGADGRTALERHADAAGAVLQGLDPARGDRAGLILLSNPAQGVVVPAAGGVADVERLVRGARATDARADLHGALGVLRGVVDAGGSGPDGEEASDGGTARRVEAVVLSDFAGGAADLSRALPTFPEGALRVRLPDALGADAGENVSIVSAVPLRALVLGGEREAGGGGVPVRVSLARSGTTLPQAVTRVQAWLGPRNASVLTPTERAASATVAWESGQREATVTLGVVMGGAGDEGAGGSVLVTRIDEDALEGDNTRLVVLDRRPGLRVVVVADEESQTGGQSPETFSAARWIGLALAPARREAWEGGAGGGVRVERAVPGDLGSGVGGGVLAGASAVIVTTPHRVDDAGWVALRGAREAGALVMIVPPADQDAHAWTDKLEVLAGAPVGINPQVRTLDEAEGALRAEAGLVGLASGEGAQDAAGAGVGRTREARDGADLLALVRGELEELTRSVRVRRVLTLEDGAPVSAVLSLRDGSPVVGVVEIGAGANAGPLVVWMTSPVLAWTDLPAKPLMVPLVQELLRQGVGSRVRRSWVVAGEDARGLGAGASDVAPVVLVRGDDAGARAEDAGEALRVAGLWDVRDDAGRVLATLAVQPDARGADVSTTERARVEAWLTATGAEVVTLEVGAGARAGEEPAQADDGGGAQGARRDDDRAGIAWTLLLAAGALALLEVFVARWFSHARVGRAGATGGGGA